MEAGKIRTSQSAVNRSDQSTLGRFKFESRLWLPERLEVIFSFFADARNLQELTPAWLNFQIPTPSPIVIQQGTLINYKLRVHGIPFRWCSEISVWEPPFRFVDKLLKGPYRLWVHEHTFCETNGGTTIVDRVEYDIFGGKLVQRILVHPDIERIFSHRHQRMLELFGSTGQEGI